mgnify:CR=1 FL=1
MHIIFIKEIKYVLRAFITWREPRQMFGRIWEQISKNLRSSRGFSPFREFSQSFLPGYECTENIFYFFHNIIFCLKEKIDIRSTYVYFLNFFHETVKSHNLEAANHNAHVIFVLHCAMKTHLWTNQNARTIQII